MRKIQRQENSKHIQVKTHFALEQYFGDSGKQLPKETEKEQSERREENRECRVLEAKRDAVQEIKIIN